MSVISVMCKGQECMLADSDASWHSFYAVSKGLPRRDRRNVSDKSALMLPLKQPSGDRPTVFEWDSMIKVVVTYRPSE